VPNSPETYDPVKDFVAIAKVSFGQWDWPLRLIPHTARFAVVLRATKFKPDDIAPAAASDLSHGQTLVAGSIQGTELNLRLD
jgi:hypothetical protein